MNKFTSAKLLVFILLMLILMSVVSAQSVDYVIPFTGVNVSLDDTVFIEQDLYGIRINNEFNKSIYIDILDNTSRTTVAYCAFPCTIQLDNANNSQLVEIVDTQTNATLLRAPLFRSTEPSLELPTEVTEENKTTKPVTAIVELFTANYKDKTITVTYRGDLTVPVVSLVSNQESIYLPINNTLELNRSSYFSENTSTLNITLYDSSTLINTLSLSLTENNISKSILIDTQMKTHLVESTSLLEVDVQSLINESTPRPSLLQRVLDFITLTSSSTPEYRIQSVSLYDELGNKLNLTTKLENLSLNVTLPSTLPGKYILQVTSTNGDEKITNALSLAVNGLELTESKIVILNKTYNRSQLFSFTDAQNKTIEVTEIIRNKSLIEVTPLTGSIKKLEINATNLTELINDNLRFDANLTNISSLEGFEWNHVYAIDPEQTNVSTVTLTVKAQGTTVYKCATWNFTASTCPNNDWKFLRSITPGETYTLTIDPKDPAFGEGDTQSQADSCTFSDEALQGDGDLLVDCLTEVNSNDGGFTADLDDSERAGQTASMDLTFTNSFVVETINEVNVTFEYQRQTNTQVGATTASIQLFNGLTYDEICTDTVTIGSWELFTCDLTASITTQTDLNDIQIRLVVDTDRSGQPQQSGKTYVDTVYLGIDYEEPDLQAPIYSNIVTSQTSPATYNSSNIYYFNTTWTDTVAIDTVIIEHNFSGVLTNESALVLGSDYYFNTSLAAGSYVWRFFANDTSNNLNQTPQQTFVVNKANPNIIFTLNGTTENITIENSGAINASAIGGESIIEILENGLVVASSANIVEYLQTYSTVGTINLTARYNESQNYTAQSKELIVTVIDTIPPAQITNLNNQSSGESWIYWNWSNPIDVDFDHVEIWLNNSFVENTTANFINISGLVANTEYEVQIRTADIYDNVGDFVNDTARTLISLDITPPILTNISNYSITVSSAIINWTTDEISNSRVKYGTTSGTYTNESIILTNVLDHSITLTGLEPATIYYYVVNSTDIAGNSNESIEYTFTTLVDVVAPEYNSLISTPTSPTTYSAAQTYTFNITWIDQTRIDTVLIEHNFTGTLTNYSTTRTGDNYNYSHNALSAGIYVWRFIANDSSNNVNQTPYQTLTINKAQATLDLEINGINNNVTVDEDTSVNVTATLTSGIGQVQLRRNNTLIAQNNGVATNINSYEPGTYFFEASYFESENFTSSYTNRTLTVSDITFPTVSLTSPANNTVNKDSIVIFSYDATDNVGVTSCSLYINNVFNQSDTSVSASDSFEVNTFTNGNYTWLIECVDSASNAINSSLRNFTISIDPPILRNITVQATDNWDDGDAISVTDINATDAFTESRAIAKNTQRFTLSTDFTTNIPAGATIESAEFFVRHQGNTRTTFEGINWYNGATYVDAGCTPVSQTGAFRIDSCDISSAVNTVDEANNISIQYIVSASNQGSGGSIDVDHMYVEVYYLPELTPPVFNNLNNLTVGVEEGVAFQVNATDTYGISSYGINDTVLFSINSSGYITNSTSLALGSYYLNITAVDPTGNNVSKVIRIDVEELVRVILQSTGDIAIYNASGDLVFINTQNLNEQIIQNKLYDIIFTETISGQLQRTTLFDVNLSSGFNNTGQVTEVYAGSLPTFTSAITPIFALVDLPVNYSKAQVILPKNGLSIDYIYHCTAWNFTSRDCSSWEDNLTSEYEYSENSTHMTFNVTGFDAFGGGPGDTLPNLTSITVYDVTDEVNKQIGGTLVSSGVGTNFDLVGGNVYRVEFNITNLGNKWNIAASDVVIHSGLNNSWNITNISYVIAGTNYVGGTFDQGNVTWDLSLGGTLNKDASGIWKYIVNITTTDEQIYPLYWIINDTSKNSGSTDNSNYTIITENSPWFITYGDVFSNLVVGDNSANVIYEWTQTINGGNLYFVDSDASIAFSNLKPLGRDNNNNPATNDFAEADTFLNISSFSDSIESRFSTDGSNPKQTKSYTVYENTLTNVAYINTTNGNFTTAILWDNSSDTTGEFDLIDNETLVFITELNMSALGTYGTYDYEITIPEQLQDSVGVTSSLDIYVEIS